MTRKRFIKLIMSAGVGRDAAEGLAWIAWTVSPSYVAAWNSGLKEALREKKEALHK